MPPSIISYSWLGKIKAAKISFSWINKLGYILTQLFQYVALKCKKKIRKPKIFHCDDAMQILASIHKETSCLKRINDRKSPYNGTYSSSLHLGVWQFWCTAIQCAGIYERNELFGCRHVRIVFAFRFGSTRRNWISSVSDWIQKEI